MQITINTRLNKKKLSKRSHKNRGITRQTCFSQWDTIFGGFRSSVERHGRPPQLHAPCCASLEQTSSNRPCHSWVNVNTIIIIISPLISTHWVSHLFCTPWKDNKIVWYEIKFRDNHNISTPRINKSHYTPTWVAKKLYMNQHNRIPGSQESKTIMRIVIKRVKRWAETLSCFLWPLLSGCEGGRINI